MTEAKKTQPNEEGITPFNIPVALFKLIYFLFM